MRCMTRLGLVESMNSLKSYILIRLKYMAYGAWKSGHAFGF